MGGRGGSGRSNAGTSNQEAQAPTFVSEFLSAYRDLPKTNSQGWVKLADLRDALPNRSRNDFDQLASQLANNRRVTLIPEENQSTLRTRDREAALRYGGEAQHLIRVE